MRAIVWVAVAAALLAPGPCLAGTTEDLLASKERFFTLTRRTFWDSPEASPRRALMQTLIGKLDF